MKIKLKALFHRQTKTNFTTNKGYSLFICSYIFFILLFPTAASSQNVNGNFFVCSGQEEWYQIDGQPSTGQEWSVQGGGNNRSLYSE